MVIVWTSPAVNDLENFKKFSKKTNIKDYLKNLVEYAYDLKQNPRLGKVYTYTQGTIIRQLIYKEHKIYYSIEEEKIHILTVIHSRQDTKQRLIYIKNELSKKT